MIFLTFYEVKDYFEVNLIFLEDKGLVFSVYMIVKAGQERMAPVMMTALTSGIALVLIALSPENQKEKPCIQKLQLLMKD